MRDAHCSANPDSEESMTTSQTSLAAADSTESEIICKFLRVSGAYLFSCAYRDSLRAAYMRHAASDPVAVHGIVHRESDPTVTRL
jgi:hypothetical protein